MPPKGPNDQQIIEDDAQSYLDMVCDATGITTVADWLRPKIFPAPAPGSTIDPVPTPPFTSWPPSLLTAWVANWTEPLPELKIASPDCVANDFVARADAATFALLIRCREFAEKFPKSKYPQRLNIFWKMAKADQNGLPADEEANRLATFEDRLG